MGIPKLMQDLSSYTERVFLGRQNDGNMALSVLSIVIDGPSLVYHVYERIMGSLPDLQQSLTYRDINVTVVQVLDEIRSHGVDIKKIYFDGALPISKRETRLRRLERHRFELEKYNRSRVTKNIATSGPQKLPSGRELLQETTCYAPSIHNLKALEPPFMVANAIEHLSRNMYGSVVELIPDEAEVGCVMHTLKEGTAILSNDSDLLIYPTTKHSVLIILDTLQHFAVDGGKTLLMAECLIPSVIEDLLQISSLSCLAFERHLDANASFGVVKTRAQMNMGPRLQKDQSLAVEYQRFFAQYQIDIGTTLSNFISFNRDTRSTILDPRLSELYCQYRSSGHVVDRETALHIYLPALTEDPTRESPWAHGSNVRRLTYSLLNLSMSENIQKAFLFEFQRRGNRVSGVEISLFARDDLREAWNEIASLLQQIKSNGAVTDVIASWHQVALQEVQKRRRSEQRTGSLPTHHLRACAQAVLYSLRLLKQITELELVRDDPSTSQKVPRRVFDRLVTMPALADLMDSTRDLVMEE